MVIYDLDDPRSAGIAIYHWDDSDPRNLILRLEALSIQVGDDPLDIRINPAVIKLNESSMYTKSVTVRRQLLYCCAS